MSRQWCDVRVKKKKNWKRKTANFESTPEAKGQMLEPGQVEFVIPVHTEDLLDNANGRLGVVDDIGVATLGAPNVKKLIDGELE